MEKEEDYMASLLQHSTLIGILKHLLLPRMFVWQTIDDRVGCLDVGNGHWRIIFQMDIHIYPLVILIKYSASDYYPWSQILSLLFHKADVVAQLLTSNTIVQLLKSYIVLKFLKFEIVIKFLKSDNVADIRYSVQYEALFIEASFAIAYCIEQYFSLYFSRCADATPIDTS